MSVYHTEKAAPGLAKHPIAGRWGVALPAALIAALLANALDAVTTWVGISQLQGHEVAILGRPVLNAFGLVPGLLLLKGAGVLLILGTALAGQDGPPRWWRLGPHYRWVAVVALWIVAVWFGFLAMQTTWGMWMVMQIGQPSRPG